MSSKPLKRRGTDVDQRFAASNLRESRYSQSLERGLAILGCFRPQRPVLGIADIAEELGMSRSTTHRYVITLVALGYLEQGASRKYRLGLQVTDLGMSALSSTGLAENARCHLEELRRQSSHSVGLAVLEGPEILYVDRAPSLTEGQSMMELNLASGSRLPAYCTAMGKVLLAYLPESEERRLTASVQLRKRGPNTITSRSALRAELERVATQGFAVNDEELAPGVRAIAAPVRGACGEVVAAISIAARASVIPLEALVGARGSSLLLTADRISARLGFRRHDE